MTVSVPAASPVVAAATAPIPDNHLEHTQYQLAKDTLKRRNRMSLPDKRSLLHIFSQKVPDNYTAITLVCSHLLQAV